MRMAIPMFLLLATAATAPAQTRPLETVSAQQKVVLSYFHDVLDGRKLGLLEQLFHPDCAIHRPEGTINGLAGHYGEKSSQDAKIFRSAPFTALHRGQALPTPDCHPAW